MPLASLCSTDSTYDVARRSRSGRGSALQLGPGFRHRERQQAMAPAMLCLAYAATQRPTSGGPLTGH